MASRSSMNDARILVVDDEPDLRTLYELTLLREGYRVDAAETLADARDLLALSRYDVIITDMRLPDGMGLEIIQYVRQLQRGERCVVITAYGSADNAVESLKAGAFDYLTKPVDLRQFRDVVASALQAPGLTTEARRPLLVDETVTPARPGSDAALERLVGHSSAIQMVRERIVKVARGMAPILITGESGTGKELVAKAIHANSHRAEMPMVAVNCSAIPADLLELEFFGARKGAFTGASHDRQGLFQAAKGGTFFLDEIGDLPLAMQAKLLRAIQERCIRPIGATQEEPVDVRIISASHKNLPAEIAAGRFRQDLYYRLNVIEIGIPPLRERLDDLPLLCKALLSRIAAESRIPPPPISDALLKQLSMNPFAGNIRELENILYRAVALHEAGPLALQTETWGMEHRTPAHDRTDEMDTSSVASGTIPADLQTHLDNHEREILVQALQRTGFNRTAAAALLGLNLRQIRYRIARLNILVPGSPEAADDSP